MKFKELKNLNETQLNEKLGEAQKELIKSNGQVSTGTVPKSPGQIRNTKKAIAKIKMLLGTKKGDKKE